MIACALVASHGIRTLLKGKVGLIVFSLAFVGLGVCLIQTYSRGGIVAALSGQVVYLWFVLRGRAGAVEKSSWIRGIVLSVILVVYASVPMTNAVERYSQGWFPGTEEDRSISNRLRIWKDVPRMMHDAPGGWGLGKSGEAWSRWYQPTDTRYIYRTLVNSHFTWLVEFGWVGRICYVFGWAMILFVCAMRGGHSTSLRATSGISTGVWIAFGVAAFFSSVAESWVLWLLPLLGLLTKVIFLLKEETRGGYDIKRSARSIILVSVPGLLLLLSALAWSSIAPSSKPAIEKKSNSVVVGDPPYRYVLIQPDEKVVGQFFSFDIRSDINSGGWQIMDDGPVKQLNEYETVVFSGTIPSLDWTELERNSKRMVILNPFNIPEKLSGQRIQESIIVGKMRNDPVAKSLKRKYLVGQSSTEQLISGRKNYLSNWLQIVQSFNPQ